MAARILNPFEAAMYRQRASDRRAQEARMAVLEAQLSSAQGLIAAHATTIASLVAGLSGEAAARGAAISGEASTRAAADTALGLRATALETAFALQPLYVAAAPMTVADLLANYAPAANIGKLAKVTDLFGELATSMIAEQSGSQSYWRPTRTDFAKSMAMSAMPATLYPLTSAPSLRITGVGLGGTRTLSGAGAWPGHVREITVEGLTGASTLILNLAGGLVVTLSTLLGQRVRMRWDGSAYYQV